MFGWPWLYPLQVNSSLIQSWMDVRDTSPRLRRRKNEYMPLKYPFKRITNAEATDINYDMFIII